MMSGDKEKVFDPTSNEDVRLENLGYEQGQILSILKLQLSMLT